MSANDSVSAGKVVTIHYHLTLDDGQVVDSSRDGDPLAYLHGAQNIVPGLESALDGKAKGEELAVKVSPEEGYGPRHEGAIQDVPRQAFPEDAQLQVGVTFQAQDEQERPMIGTIKKLEGDSVTVDFNHPLAGQNLNFEVSVEEIRDATKEEQDHGHVHGAGGHDH